MQNFQNLLVGEVVTSVNGRDEGINYIILSQDQEFVYLVNGKTRFFEKPKKKKIKHVVKKDFVIENLQNKILNNQKIYNEEVYSAFKKNNIKFSEKEENICLKKM